MPLRLLFSRQLRSAALSLENFQLPTFSESTRVHQDVKENDEDDDDDDDSSLRIARALRLKKRKIKDKH